jgi:hypothetical protein
MIDRVGEQVFAELGCTEALTRAYIEIALSDIATFDRKQHDYGPDNIAAFGERGVVVRMNDKMARLRNLVWGGKLASNEAVEDSYADLSVYGVIARMCRAGVWPGVPADATVPPAVGLQAIWTDHALRGRPEAVPPYDTSWASRGHEPDHWEDTPPEADGLVYWCPRCQRAQLAERQDGGFVCSVCRQFLFGPGIGSVRNS